MNQSGLFRATVALSALGILAGCNKGDGSYKPSPVKKVEVAEIAPGDGPEIFPVKVGNRWTYSIESRQTIAGQPSNKLDEMSLEIVDVKDGANGKVVTIQASLNGEPTDKQAWLVGPKGIQQMWIQKEANAFNPPQPMVMFPLAPGKNFAYKGTGPTIVGRIGSQTHNGRLLATQLVDTEMGPFSAVAVESDGSFEIEKAVGQTKVTTFWAKGVGLVRFKQDTAFMSQAGPIQGTQIAKLKTYTLK